MLPLVSREVAGWRRRALAMPPGPIRDDALSSLDGKRFHTEGAALFATLPPRRDERLLRLLVTHQLLWDFLDTLSERPCEDIVGNGLQLHRAVAESLDPHAPLSDYYVRHPRRDDGGYLRALVQRCQALCSTLPSYASVHELVAKHARLASVCALNHEPSRPKQEALLQEWAERELPQQRDLAWYERSAAASSPLATHALLVLGAQRRCDEQLVHRTAAAYFPWVNLSGLMLDSFADLVDDRATGNHSYLSHYPSLKVAVARMQELAWRAASGVRALPRGERHALLATGMVAMYLSEQGACTPEMRPAARAIMRASGRLPGLLWPILRIWRRAAR